MLVLQDLIASMDSVKLQLWEVPAQQVINATRTKSAWATTAEFMLALQILIVSATPVLLDIVKFELIAEIFIFSNHLHHKF